MNAICLKFETLKNKWEENTKNSSFLSDIFEDSNYKSIKELGNNAIPYIFNEIEANPRIWMFALYDITGENPIASENIGQIDKMQGDWRNWGKNKNYIV